MTVETRAVSTGQVVPGETFRYRISALNHGPSRATNVAVTDVLPAPLAFVSSPDGCTADGQTVTCGPAATLAAGALTAWTITVRLDPAYTGDGGDIRNRATVTTGTHDPRPDNDTGPDGGVGPPGGTVAPPSADLSVRKKTENTQAVAPGETFRYVVAAVNRGPSTAVRARITDELPEGLAFVASDDGCTADGRTVTCGPAPALAPDATADWTFTVRVAPGYRGTAAQLANRAHATADTPDPNPDNNSGPAPGVTPPTGELAPAKADLTLTKRAEGGPVAPGGTFVYTLTATNHGPSTATGVKLVDRLPQHLAFVSAGATGSGGSGGSGSGCTAEGRTVTCLRDRLEPDGHHTVRLTVRLARDYDGDGSDIVNTASVTSTATDPDPHDNTATAVGLPNPDGSGKPKPKPTPTPTPKPTPTHQPHRPHPHPSGKPGEHDGGYGDDGDHGGHGGHGGHGDEGYGDGDDGGYGHSAPDAGHTPHTTPPPPPPQTP
ncbi:protein of unknown function DUF11, partial [Actinobacteria bacterium OK074]